MKNLITELYRCYDDVDTPGIRFICHGLYEKNKNDSLLYSMLEYNPYIQWSFNEYTLFNKSVLILLKRLCIKYREGLGDDEYPDQDIVQIRVDVTHFLNHIFELSVYDKLMLKSNVNI